MNVNVVKEVVKEFYSSPEYEQIIFLIDDDIIIHKDSVNEIIVYYDTLKVTTIRNSIIYYNISNIKIIQLL
jgi:hypothetical protein